MNMLVVLIIVLLLVGIPGGYYGGLPHLATGGFGLVLIVLLLVLLLR